MATLLSLCLASRKVGQEALRALYHTIVLKRTNRSLKREQVHLLLHSFKSNSELAPQVRSLKIHYWYYSDLIDEENQIRLGVLLEHLTNLRSLTLLQSGCERVWGGSCPRWMMRCPVGVESLHTDFSFANTPEFFPLHPNLTYLAGSDIPRDICQRLPRLTSLRIGNQTPFRSNHNITQLSAVYAEQHELCWTVEVVPYFGPHLVTLHLHLGHHRVSDPILDDLLSTYTPNLQFLWLQFWKQREPFTDGSVSYFSHLSSPTDSSVTVPIPNESCIMAAFENINTVSKFGQQ